MYYWLYRLLSIILQPILKLVAWFRLSRGWEDYKRIKERYGYPSLEKPKDITKTIWIHCASVGESISSLSLVEKVVTSDPNVFVVITTMTKTAADIMDKRLQTIPRATHQYIPYDSFIWIRRFLENWEPEKLLLFESEFWPNLLEVTYNKGIPIYLVNARISDKSAKLWKKYEGILFQTPFKKLFKKAFTQTKQDKEKLESLGLDKVYSYGNMKYCAAPPVYDSDEVQRLLEIFSTNNIWLASSTHQGEDEILLKAHKIIKESIPDAVLIIAPRHPERRSKIKDIALNDFYFNTCIRSKSDLRDDKDKPIDVYIADTMGELGTFYKLSPISFVAGSLLQNIGGHNIIEPAQLKSTVLHGPYMHNFSEVAEIFKQHGAAIETSIDAKDIASIVCELLSNERQRRNQSKLGKDIVAKMQNETLDKVYWSILNDQEL